MISAALTAARRAGTGRRRPRIASPGDAPRAPGGVPPQVAAAVAAGQLAVLAVAYQVLVVSPRLAAAAALVVAVVDITLLTRLRGNRQISLGSMWLIIYALFHVGLATYLIRGALPDPLKLDNGQPRTWLLSPQIPHAVTLVAVSISVYLLGYSLMWWSKPARNPGTAGARESHRGAIAVMRWVGPLLTIVGIALLLGVVLAEGLSNLGADNFQVFRNAQNDPQLSWAFMCMGLGMAALGTSGWSGSARWWFLIFLPFLLLPLAIGARSGTIFPMAAYIVALSRRHWLRLRLWHGGVLLVLLSIGSVIRQARNGGPTGFRLADASLDPLGGLGEMSATLRPVVSVLEWTNVERQPLVGWDTYWAPVGRLIGRVLGLPITPATMDERSLSTAVMARPNVGAIGGSPTAEAYRAAGLVGVVVVLALLGAVVAHLDARASGSIWEYAVPMVGYVLMVWARNDFTPVVFQTGLGLSIIVAARLLAVLAQAPPELRAQTHSELRAQPLPEVWAQESFGLRTQPAVPTTGRTVDSSA
ncbi:O-antigen polysaccharide polymerase Wzy [Micromonospora sp. NPDC049559]|uniref:O-antigen polysaccharide polymerase Wzy n=1 Tax=Micromonospora sp. NPDC049559 TaxID=3155923 RepID=UPI003435AE80